MALGGTIRGTKTALRLPVDADLDGYNRWMSDLRVRRAHRVWHEPAMPATWKERLREAAKEKRAVVWSIEAEGRLIGLAAGDLWSMGNGFSLGQLVIDPDEWRKGYGFDEALALHRYLFDYLDLRRTVVELRLDNVAAQRIADRLGYAAYAHGYEVHYREGGYVDEAQLLMENETWHERWTGEREYPPLPADARA